ncbi:hypothetical protein HOH87_02140 [bacterium]|jgi:hypothetical protein|nr:hypothetical protein [bacterium]
MTKPNTTLNNNNEYKNNTPYVADLLESLALNNEFVSQLKVDLDTAKNQLNKLKELKKEAGDIYLESTQLLEDIHDLLYPLLGGSQDD